MPNFVQAWECAFNKLSELNKRVNAEAPADRCCVAVLKNQNQTLADVLRDVLGEILKYSEENTCVGVCL